jgi:hypothetical protein
MHKKALLMVNYYTFDDSNNSIVISNDNNNKDCEDWEDTNIKNNLKQWITDLQIKFKEIEENIDDVKKLDSYIGTYKYKSCNKCTSLKKHCRILDNFLNQSNAKNKLFSFKNGLSGKIISSFQETNLEILIAGSSGLNSVLKAEKYSYEPNDIDFYVKNINADKIKIINDCIERTFNNNVIYIVRRPITMTWWIFDNNNTQNIIAIMQLNLLMIQSWTEIFAVYHADMLCIGYDVKFQKFITLKHRWNNFFTKNLDSPIFFTNAYNIDNSSNLQSCAVKYEKRHFNTIVLENKKTKFDHNGTNSTKTMSGSHSMSGQGSNPDYSTNSSNSFVGNSNGIIKSLSKHYSICEDFLIDMHIENLILPNEEPPRILKLKYIIESEFYNIPFKINFQTGFTCPIILEDTNLLVKGSECKHYVSLKTFVIFRQPRCPCCRSDWSEPYIITVNDYNYFNEDINPGSYKKHLENNTSNISSNFNEQKCENEEDESCDIKLHFSTLESDNNSGITMEDHDSENDIIIVPKSASKKTPNKNEIKKPVYKVVARRNAIFVPGPKLKDSDDDSVSSDSLLEEEDNDDIKHIITKKYKKTFVTKNSKPELKEEISSDSEYEYDSQFQKNFTITKTQIIELDNLIKQKSGLKNQRG